MGSIGWLDRFPSEELVFELDVDLAGDDLGDGGVDAELPAGGFGDACSAFPLPAGFGEVGFFVVHGFSNFSGASV
jgi:hypothetical protein